MDITIYPAHSPDDSSPEDDSATLGPPVPVNLIYHPPSSPPAGAVVPARTAVNEPSADAATPSQPSQPRAATSRRRASLSRRHSVSVPPHGAAQDPPLNLTRHESRCTICRHPERDAIEEEFVHWHRPGDIAWHYKIDMRAIYRHAHAFDLYSVRDRNLRFALGHVVQRAEEAQVTADSIVRAVRAYSRVNHAGQWIDPPAHVVVTSGSRVPAAAAPAELTASPEPRFELLPAPEAPALEAAEASESLDTESQTKHDPTC
jgi:hypothetical protein